jgi:hypothetical protein
VLSPWEALTDARGEFLIRGLPAGPVTVTATHDLLGDATAELELRPGGNATDLILDARGRVQGRVVDAAGEPVPGARVSLLQGAGATSQAVGIDGRFLFRRVAPGTYHLTASAPGLVLAGPPPEVEVTGSPLPAIDLVLVGGGEIYGELRGLTADQPSEVWIAAYCEQCGSDSARRMVPAEPGGRYRLAGLAPGRWMVVAVDPATGRSARGEVEVEEGGGAYRLELAF